MVLAPARRRNHCRIDQNNEYCLASHVQLWSSLLVTAPNAVSLLFLFPTSLCGVLVFDSVSRSRSRPLLPAPPLRQLSHTTLSHIPSFTHSLSHTLFHTQLCHTPSFTHSLSHHLSHTTLSHTIFHTLSFTHSFVTHHLSHTLFHTQLCHTPSFTHNFVTHHLAHTTLSRTIFHTQLCGTWHLATSTFVSRGKRPTRHFAWHGWHLATSTFTSRGRRGTYGTGLALVARLGAAWALIGRR